MAITISGENNNDRILASDGVIDSLSGFNVVGVITATSFTGDLTGDVTGNLTGNVTGNINNTTLLLQTGGTERLRIDSSGRLIIGDTSTGNAFSGGDSLVIGNTSSGTRTGVTLVSANDEDGGIYFSDGTSSGNANVQGQIVYNHSNNNLTFYTQASARLRINSSGNVQVNGGALHLDASGELAVFETDTNLSFTNSAKLAFDYSGNIARIRSSHNGSGTTRDIAIYTANSERLYITPAGKIGINTTTPYSALEVQGDNGVNNATITFTRHGTPVNDGVIGQNFYRIGTDSVAAIGAYRESAMDDAYIAFHTQPTGGSFTERLRITSNGRVLIGTTTEGSVGADELTIATSGSTGLTIRSGTSNDGNVFFSDTTSGTGEYAGYVQYEHANNALRFGTASEERLRITSAGDVGIGYNSPTVKLHIREAASGYSGTYDNRYHCIIEDDAEAYYGVYVPNNGYGGIRFHRAGGGTSATSAVGYIDCYMGDEAMHYYCRGSGTSGKHIFSTGGLERLRIDENGRLLIAKGTPNSTTSQVQIGDGTTGYSWDNGDIPQVLIAGVNNESPTSGTLNIALRVADENNNNMFQIHNRGGGNSDVGQVYVAGRLGVGTNNPVQKLSVFGNMYMRQGDYITWNNGDCQIGGISGYHLQYKTYNGSSMLEHTRMTNDGMLRVGRFTAIAEGNPTEMPRVSSSRGYTSIGRDNASSLIRRFGAYRGQVSGMKLFSIGGNGAQTWARVVIATILGTPSFQVCYQEFLYSGNKNLIDSRYRGNNHTTVVTLAWSGDELQYSCNNSNYYSTIEVELGAPNDNTGNGWYPTWGTSW